MEARQALRDAIAAGRSLYGKPCVDAAALFAAIDTGDRIDSRSATETPDGSISEAELTQAMVRLGIALQPEQLHAMLVSVDADKDGLIGKTELLQWLQEDPAEAEAELHRVESKRKAILAEMEHERVVAAATDVSERTAVSARAKAKERARAASRNKAFAEADADGSGELDVRELRAVLRSSGIHTTGAVFEKILRAVDVNGDGKISRDEFDRVSARLKSIAKKAEDDAAKDAEKSARLKYAKKQTDSALEAEIIGKPVANELTHDTLERTMDLQLKHNADADDRGPWLPSTVVQFDRDGNQAAKMRTTTTESSGLDDAVDVANEALEVAQRRRKAAETDMRRILADDEAAQIRERMTEAVQAFASNPIYTRYGSKARALVSRCEQLAHQNGAHPYQLLFEELGKLAEQEGRDAAESQMREKWAVAGRYRRAKKEHRESQLELEYATRDHRKAQALEHRMQLARVRIPRSVAQQALHGIIDRVVGVRSIAKQVIDDILDNVELRQRVRAARAAELRSVAKQVIDDVLENVELRRRVRESRAAGTARRRQVTFLVNHLSVAIDNGDGRTTGTPDLSASLKVPDSTSVQPPSKATVADLKAVGGRRVALRERNRRSTEREHTVAWSSADAAEWGLKRREAQQRAAVLRAKRSRQTDELKMRVLHSKTVLAFHFTNANDLTETKTCLACSIRNRLTIICCHLQLLQKGNSCVGDVCQRHQICARITASVAVIVRILVCNTGTIDWHWMVFCTLR
jgi:Ca2+-binding EF-hand superfamily protein